MLFLEKQLLAKWVGRNGPHAVIAIVTAYNRFFKDNNAFCQQIFVKSHKSPLFFVYYGTYARIGEWFPQIKPYYF